MQIYKRGNCLSESSSVALVLCSLIPNGVYFQRVTKIKIHKSSKAWQINSTRSLPAQAGTARAYFCWQNLAIKWKFFMCYSRSLGTHKIGIRVTPETSGRGRVEDCIKIEINETKRPAFIWPGIFCAGKGVKTNRKLAARDHRFVSLWQTKNIPIRKGENRALNFWFFCFKTKELALRLGAKNLQANLRKNGGLDFSYLRQAGVLLGQACLPKVMKGG